MIYVIDEMMGSGKTSAMINFINQSDSNTRYMFITPYLTEVSRIIDGCSGKNFKEPKDCKKSKKEDMRALIAEGSNIVTTHALFGLFDADMLEDMKAKHYTLIMDEAYDVFAYKKVGVDDYNTMKNMGFITTGEDGRIFWQASKYTGAFEKYKKLATHGEAYARGKGGSWVAVPSKELITSFETVYIMTYLFQHQPLRCFLDWHRLPYKRLYVTGNSLDTYNLSEIQTQDKRSQDLESLIHIIEHEKLNKIGDPFEDPALCYSKVCPLSVTWYGMHAGRNDKQIDRLRKNLVNFYKNISGSKGRENMWTTYSGLGNGFWKDKFKDALSGHGYARGFVVCNARGTNQFREKRCLAYVIDRYMNPSIIKFLEDRGVHVSQDGYALSEMLQWIWRSAIRDGGEITLYVPSLRMRTLLKKWIEAVKKGDDPNELF